MVQFAPVKRLRIAEQVATHIRDAILGGTFAPGDSLPSERELADQFGVNRSSVREALHRLEASGLVEMRHGGATRVRDFLLSAGFQLLPYLLAPGGELDAKMLADLLAMRTMLLAWTAREAAAQATGQDIDALATLVEALQAAETTEDLRRLDYDFFEQLVDLTGNRVLGLLANATRRVYLEHAGLFEQLYATFDPSHHAEVVEAMRAGDGERAGAAMQAHGQTALAAMRL